MDLNSMMNGYFIQIVVIGCLVIGYIIKHASFLKWIPNNDIPVILAVFGAILNAIVSGPNPETIIYGAVMGLASTGLHQAFCKFVESEQNYNSASTETNEKESE